MTFEEDRIDLLRHEKEIAAHQSFNYALMDDGETAILGCVYIDPPERTGCDGEVCWWVVDGLVGGEVERALDASVPQWIAAEWPFQHPRYLAATSPGRNGSRCHVLLIPAKQVSIWPGAVRIRRRDPSQCRAGGAAEGIRHERPNGYS